PLYPATAPPTTPLPSLHDALPICPAAFFVPDIAHRRRRIAAVPSADTGRGRSGGGANQRERGGPRLPRHRQPAAGAVRLRPPARSEEHTSELQSRENLVCRLLLEK